MKWFYKVAILMMLVIGAPIAFLFYTVKGCDRTIHGGYDTIELKVRYSNAVHRTMYSFIEKVLYKLGYCRGERSFAFGEARADYSRAVK